MAYIHNKPDIKVDECNAQKVKEMFMKYGYGCAGHKYMCEDIDEQSTKKKPYPILEEVEKILSGDRRSDYGKASASFKRIADYWNAYLCHKRDKIDEAAHEEDRMHSRRALIGQDVEGFCGSALRKSDRLRLSGLRDRKGTADVALAAHKGG